MVRLLLEKGADVEAKNQRGRTALIEATSNGHEAVVQLLLEKGSNQEKDEKSLTTMCLVV